MSITVTLDNVTISYGRHPAVHHVSGAFAAGSLTAITGPNGAGKSTLLKSIAGMIRPDEGRIFFTPPTTGHIAYLPQSALVQRDFPISVLELVATGCWGSVGSFRPITRALRAQALDSLHAVGLHGCEHYPLARLSAGQFQRALFARVRMQDAPLILLDEPFTAIDGMTTRQLLSLIEAWHREGRTVIAVLHDFDQIRAHFSQCLLLARELIGWGAPADVLNAEALQRSYFLRDPVASDEAAICRKVS